jgi:hypothetical protein
MGGTLINLVMADLAKGASGRPLFLSAAGRPSDRGRSVAKRDDRASVSHAQRAVE